MSNVPSVGYLDALERRKDFLSWGRNLGGFVVEKYFADLDAILTLKRSRVDEIDKKLLGQMAQFLGKRYGATRAEALHIINVWKGDKKCRNK
tara:strand:+ start:37 stop:312 length:276 start_codon:yes stop_codon:yes gene_type:complete